MEIVGCHMVMNGNQFLLIFLGDFMIFLHIYSYIDAING